MLGETGSERPGQKEKPELPVGRYRIMNPTIAVIVEDGRHVAHMVPAGAVVTLDSGGLEGERLVDVIWEGRKAMMFAQDLRSRAIALTDEAK